MTNPVYLIYDGECPICNHAAKVMKVRQSAGELEIISARIEHPLVQEAKQQGYDLDKGIVVKYEGKSYYGKDAMHFLAMIGSPVGGFNKINIFLFKSKTLAAVFYPIFKFIRRCLLITLGVPKIMPDNSQPIFKSIFGEAWNEMPPALKKHYANRPYTDDVVPLDGVMDIKFSKLTRIIAPLFRIFGALAPYEGENIPTVVYSKSEPGSDNYILERHFNFPDKNFIFRSNLVPLGGSKVIEIMKSGLGWYCDISYQNGKVILAHKGYRLRLFGILIPIPLGLILGKAYAEEEAIDDDNFRMEMSITHPWFGQTYLYKGRFKVK